MLVLALLVQAALQAQQKNNYFFRQLTQVDGLLHNEVYDMAQDNNGYMWVITKNGLQRYDGTRFLGFRDMLNDPHREISGAIFLYKERHENALWVSRLSNSERINLPDNNIRFFNPETLLQAGGGHYQFFRGINHNSWLVGDRAIYVYDSTNKQTTLSCFGGKSFQASESSSVVTDSVHRQVWMAANANGLQLFDYSNGQVYTMTDNAIANPLLKALAAIKPGRAFPIRQIMLDSRHNFWLSGWDKKFFQFNTATCKLVAYTLPANSKGNVALGVSCFYEDKRGAIWVGTENAGLLRFNTALEKFDMISINNRNSRHDLFNFNIHCITQDREENIWLGTDKGIELFNPYKQYFQTIGNDGNKASLPNNEINCWMQARNRNIVAGTWGGGITVYDSAWQFKKNIQFPSGPTEYNFIWSFMEADDGIVWAGCQHGYIHLYDPASGSIKTIHPPEAANSTIRCMARDAEGNIYMGLHNGKILIWNKQAKKFIAGNSIPTRQPGNFASVVNLYIDSKQRCWASTDNGLKQFNTTTKSYDAVWLPVKNNPHSISANAVTGVEAITDSTLLIGTMFGGMNLFNCNNGQFSEVLPDSSLYRNIYAIKKDKKGKCWFTTDYGLFNFDPEKKDIVPYQVAGMINSNFQALNFTALQNGQWLTATFTELFAFYPDSLGKEHAAVQKPVITGCRVFNNTLPIDSLQHTGGELRLNHNQNFLTFEFSKLSFNPVQQTNYYYQLHGVDAAMVAAGQQSFASYTNLSPGRYRFDVASDASNDPKSRASLNIYIASPFWKRGWFAALLLAAVLLTLYLAMRQRIKRVQATAAQEKQIQEAKIEMLGISEKLAAAKLEALRSQMNPHFIFNCLASIDNLIQKGQNQKAASYLSRFARLMRSVLETSQSNAIPCWKDIETLKMYLEMEALRSDDTFNYTINVSPEIMNGDYKVPPLVIQPFVENAIQHGLLNKISGEKQLMITVSNSGHYIQYAVEDNGVGRMQAAVYQQLNKPEHRSVGMQIAIDRINLYNKNGSNAVTVTDLYNEQQQAAGTKIEVKINADPL